MAVSEWKITRIVFLKIQTIGFQTYQMTCCQLKRPKYIVNIRTKMLPDQLLNLCVRATASLEEDIVIIFTDPSRKDLTELLANNSCVLDIIQDIMTRYVRDYHVDSSTWKSSCSNTEENADDGDGEKIIWHELHEKYSDVKIKFENFGEDEGENNKQEAQNRIEYSRKTETKIVPENSFVSCEEPDCTNSSAIDLVNPWSKSNGNSRINSLRHNATKHKCSICDELLSSKSTLTRHTKLVHSNLGRQFLCLACGKAFKDRSTLKGHEKLHKTDGGRSDPCPVCGKVLANQTVMNQHIRSVHRGRRDHFCDTCGKGFATRYNLKKHSEHHEKETRVDCSVCGKVVVGPIALKIHMKTHTKDEGASACQFCGKEVLTKHLQSHIVEAHKSKFYKYECSYCAKRFPVKAAIRSHLRKHTHARPFYCNACGKYFRGLFEIKRHIKVQHNGDYSLYSYHILKDINNPYVRETGSMKYS